MDWNKVKELIEQGYIRARRHPTLPLTIYNYTEAAQFEKFWTPETMACRGLVTDDEGKIWARPFPKFFNIEEVQYKVPDEPFEVFEKMDGSLGILFNYNGKSIFASRGSFDSEQAEEFEKIWNEKYSDVCLTSDYTYLFEIIYPENRIVLDYGKERDIFCLAAVRTADGFEPLLECIEKEKAWHLRFPVRYPYNTLEETLKSNLSDKEGYVIRFRSGYRVKFKFEEYKRRHALMTETSTTTVWEMLANNDGLLDDVALSIIPDEYYAEVKRVASELRDKYNDIVEESLAEYFRVKDIVGRKAQANAIKDFKYKGLVFLLLDRAPDDDRIPERMMQTVWKLVKPKWTPLFRSFNEA